MPVNLELKAKITSPSRTIQTLRKIGGPAEILVQTDTYFRVESGRLKLRESGDGRSELIFYRRNEKKGRRWSDYSILNVSDTKKVRVFLEEIFGVDVVVRKTRHVYLYKRQARVHLDRVKGLGLFIEFEVVRKRDTKKAILLYRKLIDIFGIERKNVIRCSYADLIRAQRGVKKLN